MIPRTLRYVRKRLAEDPNYRFREIRQPSPMRWDEEHLTERWAERKARRAMERRSCD